MIRGVLSWIDKISIKIKKNYCEQNGKNNSIFLYCMQLHSIDGKLQPKVFHCNTKLFVAKTYFLTVSTLSTLSAPLNLAFYFINLKNMLVFN